MSHSEFLDACKDQWQDIADARMFHFAKVIGRPSSMPSTIAHVLLYQGDISRCNLVLFHSAGLPPLYRQRAVLYPVTADVSEFFLAAQYPEICQASHTRCFLTWDIGFETIQRFDNQLMDSPFAMLVEGLARVDEASDSDESDSNTTQLQTSTAPPDTDSEDSVSLVSTALNSFQFEQENPYPWQQLDLPEQLPPHELIEHTSIIFAEDHLGHIEDHIANIMVDLPESQQDDRWTVVTFGLAITDIGRRDAQFHPGHLNDLYRIILDLWDDQAQFGDLVVYNVHPQPMDIAGEKSIVVIVSIEIPGTNDARLRSVLVHERSADDVQVRPVHYAARIFTGSTLDQILTQLGLHRHCPPVMARDCRIRLGTTCLEDDAHYEFDHGMLALVWIGKYWEEVDIASRTVSNAETFFLQWRRMLQINPSIETTVMAAHGISPSNRPLGRREVICSINAVQSLVWIEEMQQLWPFSNDACQIGFVPDMSSDFQESEFPCFHFVINYGPRDLVPILLHQQIEIASTLPRQIHTVDEFWAIGMPHVLISQSLPGSALGSPFWFRSARALRVYPHLSVDGRKAREAHRVWNTGDLLKARFLVWQQHHSLLILMQSCEDDTRQESFEFTSLLQISVDIQIAAKNQGSVQDAALDQSSTHTPCWQLSDAAFVEICETICHDERQSSHDHAAKDGHIEDVPHVDLQNHREAPRVHSLQSCDEVNSHAQVLPNRCENLDSLNVALRELSCSPWKGLCQDFENIPCAHPSAQWALFCTPIGVIQSKSTYHIFTDGACRAKQAAWAFVVLKQDFFHERICFHKVGFAGGLLNQQLDACEVNALNAEATALIGVAEFLLSLPSLAEDSIVCHYDALSVGHGTFGDTKCCDLDGQRAPRLVAARILMSLVQRKAGSIRGCHVHAHRGQPWNELADSIAGAICDGWRTEISAEFRSQMLLRHPLREWAWLQIAPTEELPGLEDILHNRQPRTQRGCLDATLDQSRQSATNKSWSAKLLIATANVSTLDQYHMVESLGVSYKTVELLHQMQKAGVHIMGVQEGRARESRHIKHGPFDCLVSAGVRGQAGVELWFHTAALSQLCGQAVQIQNDVCVWLSTPRLLAASCNFGGVYLDILVGYAPQAGRPADEILQWWDEVNQALSQVNPKASVILLGDFNCKVGSVCNDFIGDHDADFEDAGGEQFRHVCDNHSLMVPSTWGEWHRGSSATFRGPKGNTSRIDYIAIDYKCLQGVVQTYVATEMDLLNGDRDHLVLVLELALEFSVGSRHGFVRKPLYDRVRAKSFRGDKTHDLFASLPSQTWEQDVNEHWSNMREFLQTQAAAYFPKPKRQQRQLYFNEETWNLVCTRKDLRQHHRALQREFQEALLHHCFRKWRRRAEVDIDDQWHRRRHLMWQQEALVYAARQSVDSMFRQKKKEAWRTWVDQHLQLKIEGARQAKGVDLFRVLKPKQMIQKHAGQMNRSLPGLKDASGNWKRTRNDIAIAWQKQFGDIEHADEVSFEDLQERSQPRCQCLDSNELHHIPTLYDLEAAVRSLKSGKAPGLDNLGTELFQMDVSRASQRIFALHLKTAVRRQNIPELTGGWLLPLHKKKGSAAQMTAYRAILLEPVIARMFSRAWRPQLIAGVQKVVQPLQYGGRSGLGIEALHLQVRVWQSSAKHSGDSLGLVFIDIKSAFYSVIKSMLASFNGTADSLGHIFQRLQLPAESFQEFLQCASTGQLVQKATNSQLVADGVAAMLGHTWFVVPHGNKIMAPSTGSRPGDPNADVLFSFILAKLLQEIRQRAKDEGLQLTEESTFGHVSKHLSWVDDLTFAITCDARALVSKVTHLLALIIDVATVHALQLSFGPGKTAVLMEFRGKQAQRERQKVEHSLHGKLPIMTEYWGLIEVPVPVVNHYKHLGGYIVRNGVISQEIRTRAAMTMQNLKPLKRILSDKQIEENKRQYLLKSMGISVLTLHSGTWFDLTMSEFQTWQSAVFKTYQVLHSRDDQGHVKHLDHYQIACAAHGPMPMELMYLNRLRLFVHLLQNFDVFLIAAILQNHEVAKSGSWLYGLRKAISWWQKQLGTECIPNKLLQIDTWEGWHMFKDAARELRKLLRKAEKAHVIYIQTYCALQQHAKDQNQLLQEMGWTCDLSNPEPADVLHYCNACSSAFASQAALAVHQQRVHGSRMAVRRFVKDGICRCCRRNYHTRARMLRHLHWGTTRCWIFHFRTFIPVSEEEMAQMDEVDIAHGHAFHQHGLRNDKSDSSWCWATEQDLRPVLALRLDVSCVSTDDPSESELQQWGQFGLLPPGQGGRDRTCRKPRDVAIANVQRDTSALEKKLCEEVVSWTPGYDWVPPPLSRGQKYFLILFSGHRRAGDIASWFHWNTDIQPICVDLAIHETFGDVMQTDNWIQLAKARRLVGAHAGPPCETYTAARWLPQDQGIFPRPLRTSDEPWGCAYRQLAEVFQCHVGTVLMLKAIQILLWVYAFGGSITLEHPRGEHEGSQKWCIWRSSFIRQILLAADAGLVTFLQGPLGQNFPKPTSLLTARLPGLAESLYSHYDKHWQPTERLGGKSQGVWRTSKAKVYPEKLCRVIAFAHFQHAASLQCEGFDEVPETLHPLIATLTAVHDPYDQNASGTTMKADFHHPRAAK